MYNCSNSCNFVVTVGGIGFASGSRRAEILTEMAKIKQKTSQSSTVLNSIDYQVQFC